MRSYAVMDPKRCAEIVAALSFFPWQPGKVARAHEDIKHTSEITGADPDAKKYVSEIAQAINKSAIMQRDHVKDACFPRFSRYETGGEYKIHTDAAFMGSVRTDLACTLFLNDDYEGGELCIDGILPGGKPAKVKAPAGVAITYDCWRPHWVEPVTRGERIVALTWFQSRVPSAEDREILNSLHEVINDLGSNDVMSPQERFARLGSVHQKLVKRFST